MCTEGMRNASDSPVSKELFVGVFGSDSRRRESGSQPGPCRGTICAGPIVDLSPWANDYRLNRLKMKL